MTSQSRLHLQLWVRRLVVHLGSSVSFDTEVTGSTRDERDRWHEGLLEYTRLQRAVLRHWLSTDICPTLGCFTNPFPASAQGCFSSGGCQPLALSVMKTKQSSPPSLGFSCSARVEGLSLQAPPMTKPRHLFTQKREDLFIVRELRNRIWGKKKNPSGQQFIQYAVCHNLHTSSQNFLQRHWLTKGKKQTLKSCFLVGNWDMSSKTCQHAISFKEVDGGNMVENSQLKWWHSVAFLEMAHRPDVCHRGTSASLQKRRLRSGSSGLGRLGCGSNMEMPRIISARNQQLWANLKRDQTENLGATCKKKNKTKQKRHASCFHLCWKWECCYCHEHLCFYVVVPEVT